MLPYLRGTLHESFPEADSGGKRRRMLSGKLRSEEWCAGSGAGSSDGGSDEELETGARSASLEASSPPPTTTTTTTTTMTTTTMTTMQPSSRRLQQQLQQQQRQQPPPPPHQQQQHGIAAGSKKRRKKSRKKGAYAMPGRPEPSKYVGVSWVRARSKWVAQIIVKGERIHIGYFNDELEAAMRYDAQAAVHGKPVNFPRVGKNDQQAYKNGSKKPPSLPPLRRPAASVASTVPTMMAADNIREYKIVDKQRLGKRLCNLARQQEQEQELEQELELEQLELLQQQAIQEERDDSLSLVFPSTPEEDDPCEHAFHASCSSSSQTSIVPPSAFVSPAWADTVGDIATPIPTSIPMMLPAPSTPSPLSLSIPMMLAAPSTPSPLSLSSSASASSSATSTSLPSLLSPTFSSGSLSLGGFSSFSAHSASSPLSTKLVAPDSDDLSDLPAIKSTAKDGDDNGGSDWQLEQTDDLFMNLGIQFGSW